ncbi:MAG: glycine zipper 2TM domain-containing protein [Novosphingobium sp.]
MTKSFLLAAIGAAAIVSGCSSDVYGQRPGYASDPNAGEWGYYDRNSYDQYGRYDYNNPDPNAGGYYADRYYRQDRRYRERQLQTDDRVYRGRDNRYYCRRADGTTGLIVGGLAGGTLGAIIAPGDSRTLGAIIGGVGGAAIGQSLDRSNQRKNVRCR